MARGFFITLEGGDGAGKSTQAAALAETLRRDGHEVVATREPGGAPGSEAIRKTIFDDQAEWTPLGEALLFAAARDEHLRATIRPALKRGAVVICDRFADSTRAYQGAAGGVDGAVIDSLETWVVGDTRPDLTFILDIAPATALERASARGEGSDRFERREQGFHDRLRDAFLAIAAADPDRCVVIDATGSADEIAAKIADVARERVSKALGATVR